MYDLATLRVSGQDELGVGTTPQKTTDVQRPIPFLSEHTSRESSLGGEDKHLLTTKGITALEKPGDTGRIVDPLHGHGLSRGEPNRNGIEELGADKDAHVPCFIGPTSKDDGYVGTEEGIACGRDIPHSRDEVLRQESDICYVLDEHVEREKHGELGEKGVERDVT